MVIPSCKPIVLLGFMGSGKSTLGKQLAVSIGWTFTDLDRFIETEENRTISDIFDKVGEIGFRKFESHALKRVLAYSKQVIAIGGGAPCYPGNMQMIREQSISVYLKISEGELLKRLAYSTTQRPLLSGKSESETHSLVSHLMTNREGFYMESDIIIESDVISPIMILSALETKFSQ